MNGLPKSDRTKVLEILSEQLIAIPYDARQDQVLKWGRVCAGGGLGGGGKRN